VTVLADHGDAEPRLDGVVGRGATQASDDRTLHVANGEHVEVGAPHGSGVEVGGRVLPSWDQMAPVALAQVRIHV